MARIEDIERRLNNWARWKLGPPVGGLGFSSPGSVRIASGYSYREAVIPTVDCEAEETDRAVATLEEPLRTTIEKVYIGAGSMKRKAAALGVSEQTILERVWTAHRRLASWVSDQQRHAQNERLRVERLQRKAAG